MKNNNNRNLSPLVALMALAIMTMMASLAPARADDDDQKVAREALLEGKIRPLSELLEKVETMYSGQVLEVELESEDFDNNYDDEILIYEIKLLTPQGNVVKLKFDAKNLELLVTDGHDLYKARKHDGRND